MRHTVDFQSIAFRVKKELNMDKINRGLIIGKKIHHDEPHAVISHDGKKVFISKEEMNSQQAHDPISNLIGVEVDFVIIGKGNTDDYSTGSRKKAMELQAKEPLHVGDKVSFSVIKVKERFLIGVAAGREVMIPAQHISEQWVNLTKNFSTNDQYDAIVRQVDPLELDLHHLQFGAEVDISDYEVNQEYLAEIVSVLPSGIVVQPAAADVTVMCRTLNWQHQPIEEEKVVIVIVSIDEKRLYGYIKRRV